MSECIFCKIVRKEINAQIVYENDKVIAFNDINPVAPVHVLLIPKEHLAGLNDLNKEHSDLILHMHLAIKEVAKKMGIFDSGYRIISNCGEGAGQTVFHLHFHVLGGKEMGEFTA